MLAPQAWTPSFVNYTALAAALQLSLGRGIQEYQKHWAIQWCHCHYISQDLFAFWCIVCVSSSSCCTFSFSKFFCDSFWTCLFLQSSKYCIILYPFCFHGFTWFEVALSSDDEMTGTNIGTIRNVLVSKVFCRIFNKSWNEVHLSTQFVAHHHIVKSLQGLGKVAECRCRLVKKVREQCDPVWLGVLVLCWLRTWMSWCLNCINLLYTITKPRRVCNLGSSLIHARLRPSTWRIRPESERDFTSEINLIWKLRDAFESESNVAGERRLCGNKFWFTTALGRASDTGIPFKTLMSVVMMLFISFYIYISDLYIEFVLH